MVRRGTRWTIIKLDLRGREVYRWPARLRLQQGPLWLFEATFHLPQGPVQVAGMTFHPGDWMLEAYFTDRWYNVFEVYLGPQGGPLRGWYANLARPPRILPERRLAFVDLALDLVVFPQGEMVEVDREAFESLALDPHERRQALKDWEALKTAFRRGQFYLAKGMVPPGQEGRRPS